MKALPLADAAAFRAAARRTAVVRFALAALVALLGALAFLTARSERASPVPAASAPRAAPLVAAVDVSASVAGAAEEEIASVLERIARTRRSAGLVLFGDTAAEALPPATPTAELTRFVPFFRPPAGRDEDYGRDPWGTALGSGTRISAGLRAARTSLEREGGASGDVVVVSDLDTSESDVEQLARELDAYARTPAIDLHVVPLPGTNADDEAFFRQRLGGAGIQLRPAAVGERAVEAAPTTPFPVGLALLVVLIGLALALRELIAVPLAWRVHERGRA